MAQGSELFTEKGLEVRAITGAQLGLIRESLIGLATPAWWVGLVEIDEQTVRWGLSWWERSLAWTASW